MNELPTIVKLRLNAGQVHAEETHPDLGVMTAFIEDSLPKARRSEVLIHLANCAKCNELVSLATPPAIEQIERLERPKVKAAWSFWNLVPMPRFAVPAIGTALVLFAVWAIRIPLVEGPVARVAPPPSITASLPSEAPATSTEAVQTPRSSRTQSPGATTVAKATPPPSPTVVSNQPEALSRDAANVTMHTPVAPPLPANPPAAHKSNSLPVVSMVAAPEAGPCWRVSDNNTLQKATKCSDGWENISLGAPVKVRVVQSLADNVWVGGDAGALYHSADNGEHWSRVKVPMLSDDITAIVFGTPAHGRLATADGTTWATNDGGQTWRRQ